MLSARKKKKLKIVWFLIALGLVWAIHNCLSVFEGVEVENRGISFGFGGRWVIIFSLSLLSWLTYFWGRNDSLGLGLILIGGWVNMIDRMVWGYVRDYWRLITVYNNIADWMIGLGVGIFIWNLWKKNRK